MNESTPPFRAPVGTHDVLAPASAQWEGVVATFASLAHRYGFGLIITPMFEDVGVFNRGIGESSDVVSKEMYVFNDRGQRTFALRPEGTASVVRAYVQHRPRTPWKAWYVTPAFRYERPQAGRYRQHHQLGVEALGSEDPELDIEVIALAWRFFEAVGLRRVRLLINSMGHDECRGRYVELLAAHLALHSAQLCDEHRRGWSTNPLRVLDCKRSACVAVTEDGPMLPDHLCEDCRNHFARVVAGLESIGIEATLTPRLVRGFDYYTRTTFEFVADALASAQNAVGGGGRYDRLAEQLGGPPTGGIGFGCGIERLLLVRDAEGVSAELLKRTPDVFVVDTTGSGDSTVLLDELRRGGIAAQRAYGGRSMKAQMRSADHSGARFALLIGPTEQAAGQVTMRDLRSGEFAQAQTTVERGDVVAVVRELLTEK